MAVCPILAVTLGSWLARGGDTAPSFAPSSPSWTWVGDEYPGRPLSGTHYAAQMAPRWYKATGPPPLPRMLHHQEQLQTCNARAGTICRPTAKSLQCVCACSDRVPARKHHAHAVWAKPQLAVIGRTGRLRGSNSSVATTQPLLPSAGVSAVAINLRHTAHCQRATNQRARVWPGDQGQPTGGEITTTQSTQPLLAEGNPHILARFGKSSAPPRLSGH